MIQTLVAFLFVFAYLVLLPSSANAYLLPLIGAGPAFVALLIGIVFALLSALYLIFFNIHRSLRKRMGKQSSDDEDEETQDKTHSPS